MTDIKRTRPPSGPGPEISRCLATDPGQSTAPWRLTPVVVELPDVPLPYGVDHLDTDLWVDRDGRVYSGPGPYVNRPLRRLRRALSRWSR